MLAVRGDCADAATTDVLVDRAVARGLDDIYAGLGHAGATAAPVGEPADD